MNTNNNNSPLFPGAEGWMPEGLEKEKKPAAKMLEGLPENLGKAWKDCKVPDFNNPNRPRTCLEVDFPIPQINELAQLEGNAGKPIYQMSKWWARRRLYYRGKES